MKKINKKSKNKNETEVVINVCYGGFSLSHEGILEYAKRKGFTLYVQETKGSFPNHYYRDAKMTDDSYFSDRDIKRDDPALVDLVKKMKEKSFGTFAKLKVIKIPKDISWHIEEYDGYEHIAENHRTWG